MAPATSNDDGVHHPSKVEPFLAKAASPSRLRRKTGIPWDPVTLFMPTSITVAPGYVCRSDHAGAPDGGDGECRRGGKPPEQVARLEWHTVTVALRWRATASRPAYPHVARADNDRFCARDGNVLREDLDHACRAYGARALGAVWRDNRYRMEPSTSLSGETASEYLLGVDVLRQR